MKGNRVLAVGYNRGTEHAEAIAIKRYLNAKRNNGNISNGGVHIISIMFKRRNDKLGNSFPCQKCYELIKEYAHSITYFCRNEMRFEQVG